MKNSENQDPAIHTGNRKFFLPTLTKVSCLITGDDFHVLKQLNDPKSNKRIQTLAMLVLLPMIVWFAAVLMITHSVFHANWLMSVIAGIVAAMIILIIERSIIMSVGNLFTTVIRYLLAIVLAFVGAFLIDEVMFSRDIDAEMVKRAGATIQESHDAEVKNQERIVSRALMKLEGRLDEVNDEAGGAKGTGIKGVGQATLAKRETAMLVKETYDRERLLLAQMTSPERRNLLKQEIEAARKKVLDDPSSSGLMGRMKVLFQMIKNNTELFVFWAFFTALFFFVEILPVSVKYGGQKRPTLYETWTDFHTQPRN